jgi:hypothetical protein
MNLLQEVWSDNSKYSTNDSIQRCDAMDSERSVDDVSDQLMMAVSDQLIMAVSLNSWR